MTTTSELTTGRRLLLELIGQRKRLTTSQLHGLCQPDKLLQQTQRDLARLREMKLTRSIQADPQKGRSSELAWMLTRRGADLINVKYGSNYRRKPGKEQLEYERLEFALVQAIEEAGWHVSKPHKYGPTNPKPECTHQAELLRELFHASETYLIEKARRTGQSVDFERERDFDHNLHLWVVPDGANDYIAYLPGKPWKLVILILPRSNATVQFWKKRLELYKNLTERIMVVAVFTTTDEGYRRKALLNAGHISVTTIDRIPVLLRS